MSAAAYDAEDTTLPLNGRTIESRCPSLYSLIQLICVISSTAILILCTSSTMWIESYLYDGEYKYRYYSLGVWTLCYYENITLPSLATRCYHVKYKDFTLSVQICQVIAVSFSCLSLLLFVFRIVGGCLRTPAACCTVRKWCCQNIDLPYEIRKYTIISYLITILALSVSIPLFIVEANLTGVRIRPLLKRENNLTSSMSQTSTQPTSNSAMSTHPVSFTLGSSTQTLTSTPEAPPHFSVFSWALWMQFAGLLLSAVAFTMALIKQAKKRKLRMEAKRRQPFNPGRRSSVDFLTRPKFNLEMKSRPRSESQRVLFTRQPSISEIPVSP